MAKKTARSKGYRKQITKKPYLSKREIAALCIALVIIIAAAVLLSRYDDGALKVKDGKVITDGDNWLIVDGSNTRGRSRYFKLGEIGEIEGFSREAASLSSDVNIPEYVFTPEAEDARITRVTVTTSHSTSEALAKYAATTLNSFSGTEAGEATAGEAGGMPYNCFIYTTEYAEDDTTAEEDTSTGDETPAENEAPAEEEISAEDEASDESETTAEDEASTDDETPAEEESPEPNHFEKSISGYVDGQHDSCVVIHVESHAESGDGYLPDEELVEALEQVISAITLEGTGK